jgi:hypothetical protein
MTPTFVYSFDRESFMGRYASRSEALAAALKHACSYPSPITTVYVGQQLLPNPHAFGHARTLIDEMSGQVRDEVGDAADGYLRRVPDGMVTELDGELEKVVLNWLERHDLLPTFASVEAISEHPVPMQSSAGLDEGDDNEVHELGESRYFG